MKCEVCDTWIRQLEQDLLTARGCLKIAETANEAMTKRIADVGAAAKWLRDNVEFLQITPATVVAYDSGRGLEDGCEVCRGQLASDTGEAFCDALIELAQRGVSDCTEACRAIVYCVVCKRRKTPRGRSAPLEMANGLCDFECAGYDTPPQAPHMWPNEPLPGEETEE